MTFHPTGPDGSLVAGDLVLSLRSTVGGTGQTLVPADGSPVDTATYPDLEGVFPSGNLPDFSGTTMPDMKVVANNLASYIASPPPVQADGELSLMFINFKGEADPDWQHPNTVTEQYESDWLVDDNIPGKVAPMKVFVTDFNGTATDGIDTGKTDHDLSNGLLRQTALVALDGEVGKIHFTGNQFEALRGRTDRGYEIQVLTSAPAGNHAFTIGGAAEFYSSDMTLSSSGVTAWGTYYFLADELLDNGLTITPDAGHTAYINGIEIYEVDL